MAWLGHKRMDETHRYAHVAEAHTRVESRGSQYGLPLRQCSFTFRWAGETKRNRAEHDPRDPMDYHRDVTWSVTNSIMRLVPSGMRSDAMRIPSRQRCALHWNR